MTINTDYAQLQCYGQLKPKETKVSTTVPFDKWPDMVKKNTQRPHWHSRLKGKAKL